MNQHQTEDIRRLNRKILNIHWIITLISCFGAVPGASIDFAMGAPTDALWDRFFRFTLYPTACIVSALLIGEWLTRRKHGIHEFSGLLAAMSSFIILVVFHYEVNGATFILSTVILYSALYYQRSKIVLAFVLSLTSYFAIYAFHPYYRSHIDSVNLVFTVVTFIAFTFLANAVNQRGLYLFRKWEEIREGATVARAREAQVGADGAAGRIDEHPQPQGFR